MTKNKLKPIDVSNYVVTGTGQVLKMSNKVIPLEELGKRGTIKVYTQAFVKRLEKENKELKEKIAELKKKIENLQKYLDTQNCYRECAETWEQLAEAKELIKRLIKATYGEGWNYSLQVKVEAEQFLKENE